MTGTRIATLCIICTFGIALSIVLLFGVVERRSNVKHVYVGAEYAWLYSRGAGLLRDEVPLFGARTTRLEFQCEPRGVKYTCIREGEKFKVVGRSPVIDWTEWATVGTRTSRGRVYPDFMEVMDHHSVLHGHEVSRVVDGEGVYGSLADEMVFLFEVQDGVVGEDPLSKKRASDWSPRSSTSDERP